MKKCSGVDTLAVVYVAHISKWLTILLETIVQQLELGVVSAMEYLPSPRTFGRTKSPSSC